MPRKANTPQLYLGPFSQRILCAPKWRESKGASDLCEATGATFDVTEQAILAVVQLIDQGGVKETKIETGKKYRLRIVREEVEMYS